MSDGVRNGGGFRTPAKQAVAWQEAGVRKPPMHELAGRGRCYGDLENLLFRRGWRDGRCGWRGDRDAPADGSVGRRNQSTGLPSTCGDGTGRSELTVMRTVSDPVIAAGPPSPGGRSTATLLAGLDRRPVLRAAGARPGGLCRAQRLHGGRGVPGNWLRRAGRPRRAAQGHGPGAAARDRRGAGDRTVSLRPQHPRSAARCRNSKPGASR